MAKKKKTITRKTKTAKKAKRGKVGRPKGS